MTTYSEYARTAANTSMNQTSKTSSFKLTANAGKWTGARLGGLPAGGTLSVQLTTSGQVTVSLLDLEGYESLPEIRAPILTAETANDYAFSIVIPKPGDYFLVADNRFGAETRHLDVTVTASAPSQVIDRADMLNIATALLRVVEKAMSLVFLLDKIDSSATTTNIDSDAESGGISLSHDFSEAVFQTVRDQDMASNILLFTLFQGFAVRLLRDQDSTKTVANDAMDELAVALSVMFGYTDRMRVQMEYMTKNHVDQSVGMILGSSDPRILSADRAERAMKWLDDPNLLLQWSSLFLENMQRTVVEKFVEEPPAWTTSEQAASALANRPVD